MYKCDDCGHVFDEEEAVVEETSYEDYYGVSSEFLNSTHLTLHKCPYCGSEELADYYEDNEEEEEEE